MAGVDSAGVAVVAVQIELLAGAAGLADGLTGRCVGAEIAAVDDAIVVVVGVVEAGAGEAVVGGAVIAVVTGVGGELAARATVAIDGLTGRGVGAFVDAVHDAVVVVVEAVVAVAGDAGVGGAGLAVVAEIAGLGAAAAFVVDGFAGGRVWADVVGIADAVTVGILECVLAMTVYTIVERTF